MGQKKWKGFEKLRQIPKNQLLIGGLLGVLLLVVAIPTEHSEKKSGLTESQENAKSQESTSAKQKDASSYERRMEQRLTEVLEAMEGVGKVEVMITLKDDGENIVEKDTQDSSQQSAEEDGTRKQSTTERQTQKETVFAQNGSSEQTPFITKIVVPRMEGILVVAEGGDKPAVAKNISDAVLALFPIEAHKIKVVKMNL